MQVRSFVINNTAGLHIRPACVLSQGVARFQSEITIQYNGGIYNAKSVINIMSACIKRGGVVEFTTSGTDEIEAMNTVAELIAGGLGEEVQE